MPWRSSPGSPTSTDAVADTKRAVPLLRNGAFVWGRRIGSGPRGPRSLDAARWGAHAFSSEQERLDAERRGELGCEVVLEAIGFVEQIVRDHAATPVRIAWGRLTGSSGMSMSESRTSPPFELAWSAISRRVAGFRASGSGVS